MIINLNSVSLEAENQLVEEAKLDSKKFVLLYDKYLSAIYRYVFRRIDDEEVVKDVVSQTFFDALNNLKSYQYRGYPFSSWLYKIAHNNVLKWYKSVSKYANVDVESIAEIESTEDISGQIDSTLTSQRVKDALNKLDFEDKEIIRLKYFEEVSNLEIAQIMSITANNVGVKLFRALKKLKQLL